MGLKYQSIPLTVQIEGTRSIPMHLDKAGWDKAQKAYKGDYQSYYGATRTKREDWKFYALSANGQKGATRPFHVHPSGEQVPIYHNTTTSRSKNKLRHYWCKHSLQTESLRGGAPKCDGFSMATPEVVASRSI